jgi:NADPH:quinone reductase-like Zn-dependent oxidoreductase
MTPAVPAPLYWRFDMRQVAIVKHGGPEMMRCREVRDPEPAPGELRIAVRAAGVNFADVMARLGLYPDAPPPPAVVGYEVAGVVDAIGAGVTAFSPGDRVLALTRFGGYADRVVVPEVFAFRTPDGVDDVAAAALPVNYLTAFVALYRLANLAAAETVLVYGAGGGVGIAAVQLATLRDAVIIGTSSRAKVEAIRSLGVHHAIDRRDDIGAEVKRLTSGRGADVILDPIGGRSFARSYRLLAPLGRLVMYGVSSLATGERRRVWHVLRTLVEMPAFRPLSLMNRNRAVIGLNLGHLWTEVGPLRAAMQAVIDLAAEGRIRPVIARTFPLEQAADAHRYLQSRENVGKVVLTVDR